MKSYCCLGALCDEEDKLLVLTLVDHTVRILWPDGEESTWESSRSPSSRRLWSRSQLQPPLRAA